MIARAGWSVPEREVLAVLVASAALLIATQAEPDVLAASLVAAAIAMISLAGPGAAVALAGAALPLASVTVGLRGTEWSVLELALIAAAGAVGVEVIRSIRALGIRATAHRLVNPIDVTVVAMAFAAIGIVSLLWVADERFRGDSVRELRRVLIEPLVVIAAIRLIRRPSSALIAASISASAVAVALLALGQVVVRSSGVEVGSVFRPIGTYPHPNNLALYLERVAWIPLALGPRILGSRLPSWTLSAVIVVAAAATLSRGALIAVAAGGLALMIMQRKRPSPRLMIGAGVTIVVIGTLARYGAESSESVSSRLLIWESATAMIRDHPITGVGLDQFFNQYGVRYVQPAGWPERYTSHPHNAALDFWVRLGLLGVLALAGFLWLTGSRVWRNRRTTQMLLPATLLAGLVGGWTHGLIDNSFFLPDLAVFFWVTIAMSDRPAAESEHDEPR